jgi:hypothetical protein
MPIIPAALSRFASSFMPWHTSKKMCPACPNPVPIRLSHAGHVFRFKIRVQRVEPAPSKDPDTLDTPQKDTFIPTAPSGFDSSLMLWHTYKNTCPNGTKPAPSLPFPRLDTPKSTSTRVQTAEAAPSPGSTRLDTAQQEDTLMPSRKPISPDIARQKDTYQKSCPAWPNPVPTRLSHAGHDFEPPDPCPASGTRSQTRS